MAIDKATLVALPLSCYALRHPDVPEDREPFFQIDYDQASLAEHLGFRSKRGGWEEQEDNDAALEVIVEAIDWLDGHDGEEFPQEVVEDYFRPEDRGWE